MALKKFPGFIDVHVHLRDPGATQKEDFATGSRAAAAGGFTFVIDMPNNPEPTVSIDRLQEKIRLADEKSVIDIGFHYGTDGKNLESFAEAAANERVFGLKVYLNHTTGEMLIEDISVLADIFRQWPSGRSGQSSKHRKPVLVHAEGVQLAAAIALARLYDQRLHVCHISQAIEVDLVRRAKRTEQDITAGVCPHHLFLTGVARETHGSHAIMKPPLGSDDDQNALWAGLADGTIDLVETDHAPHTAEEKKADPAPFGVPGLETAVGLLFKAVHDGRLKEGDVTRLLRENPKHIFNIPDQPDTSVKLDPTKAYDIGPPYESKSGWSPFAGWQAFGKPQNVSTRGKRIVTDGRING